MSIVSAIIQKVTKTNRIISHYVRRRIKSLSTTAESLSLSFFPLFLPLFLDLRIRHPNYYIEYQRPCTWKRVISFILTARLLMIIDTSRGNLCYNTA